MDTSIPAYDLHTITMQYLHGELTWGTYRAMEKQLADEQSDSIQADLRRWRAIVVVGVSLFMAAVFVVMRLV